MLDTLVSNLNTVPTPEGAIKLQGKEAYLKFESDTHRVYWLEPTYPNEKPLVTVYSNNGSGWLAMKSVEVGSGHRDESLTLSALVQATPVLPRSKPVSKPLLGPNDPSPFGWKPSWSKPTSVLDTPGAARSQPWKNRPTTSAKPATPVPADRAAEHIGTLFANANAQTRK